jgi:hypothetical protein
LPTALCTIKKILSPLCNYHTVALSNNKTSECLCQSAMFSSQLELTNVQFLHLYVPSSTKLKTTSTEMKTTLRSKSVVLAHFNALRQFFYATNKSFFIEQNFSYNWWWWNWIENTFWYFPYFMKKLGKKNLTFNFEPQLLWGLKT